MTILEQVRCPHCGRRLADLEGRAQIRCGKCKALVDIDTIERKIHIIGKPKPTIPQK